MNRLKVSVVIPVYNVGQYVEKCLLSVLAQSYTDLEIILIDDCSADNSFEICNQYASADHRIKLFRNSRNSGVSYTRNRALDIATGAYITMIDSDDWIERDYVERMVQAMEATGADVCFCGYIKEFENEKKRRIYQITAETKKKTAREVLDCAMQKKVPFVGFACAKLYRKDVIDSAGLRFDPGISLCEDSLFNYTYLDHVQSCVLIENCLYHYRIRSQSATNSVNADKIKTKIHAFQKSLKIAEKYPGSVFYHRMTATVLDAMIQYMGIILMTTPDISAEQWGKMMQPVKEMYRKTKKKYVCAGVRARYRLFSVSPKFAGFVLGVKKRTKC